MLTLLRVLALVAGVGAAFAGWRSITATADADTARARATSVASRLAEIERLRPQQQTALLASKPTESVSTSVRAALASAGVGDGSLRAVTPGTDETVPNSGNSDAPAYRRQNITINLSPITPAQLGKFLAAWQAAEPAWIVTRIDCSHAAPESDPNSTYDARLTLTTTYLADPTPAPPMK